MSFRFSDGVDFLGEGGGQARFTVSIPLDDDGYVGRECPGCRQHFRMAHDDYDALPDDVELWCPYCGHHDDHSEFMTAQQRDRVMRAASDYATQLVGRAMDKSFGSMARRSRGSGLRVTYRSKPFYPAPLPSINEERLVRARTCESTNTRYAVFGEHRFCPVCGLLPALVTALDALDAETARLNLLDEIPEDNRRRLREVGVLDRTYADTIENVVGIVEALANRRFHEMEPNAELKLRGRGAVFQRLDDFADLFRDAGLDIRLATDGRWPALQATWAARHILTHRDGIVDERYQQAVPSSALRTGQRLRPSEGLARSAIQDGEVLCRAMSDQVSK